MKMKWRAAAIGAFLFGTAVMPVARADPIGIEQAVGKTGAMEVKLRERSPMSKSADVARRMSLNARQIGDDYDLSKEVFELYVPKEPGDGGKYGLMVSLNFGTHGEPAKSWPPVLDKYHLIWIGNPMCGEGRPENQRVGLMLDATHNARKLWPVDESRVYACISTPAAPGCGVPLYYPDVFQGGLHSVGWSWFAKISDPRTRAIWQTDKLARPDPKMLSLARLQSRFFLADRIEDRHDGTDVNELVLKQGFLQSGFKFAKLVSVRQDPQMGHYADYSADWFEEGIQFLDAPIAALAKGAAAPEPAAPGRSEPTGAQHAAAREPSRQPPAQPAPAAPAEDLAAKAAGELSLARNYVVAERYETARTRLQRIVRNYPGTPAAKDAAQLLKDIEGK